MQGRSGAAKRVHHQHVEVLALARIQLALHHKARIAKPHMCLRPAVLQKREAAIGQIERSGVEFVISYNIALPPKARHHACAKPDHANAQRRFQICAALYMMIERKAKRALCIKAANRLKLAVRLLKLQTLIDARLLHHEAGVSWIASLVAHHAQDAVEITNALDKRLLNARFLINIDANAKQEDSARDRTRKPQPMRLPPQKPDAKPANGQQDQRMLEIISERHRRRKRHKKPAKRAAKRHRKIEFRQSHRRGLQPRQLAMADYAAGKQNR